MGNCWSSALPRESHIPAQYNGGHPSGATPSVSPDKSQQVYREMKHQNQKPLKSILKPSGTFERQKSQKRVRFQLSAQVLDSIPVMPKSIDRAVLMKAIMRNRGKPAGRAPIKHVHFNIPAGHPRNLVLVAGIVLKRGRKVKFRCHDPIQPDQPALSVNSKTFGYSSEMLQLHLGDQDTKEEVALVAGLLLKTKPRFDLASGQCITSIYVDEDEEMVVASGSGANNSPIPAILGEREAKLKAKSNLANMGEEQRKIGQLLLEAEKK